MRGRLSDYLKVTSGSAPLILGGVRALRARELAAISKKVLQAANSLETQRSIHCTLRTGHYAREGICG
jgi:hypothetical protein